jgi:hypothetical protein
MFASRAKGKRADRLVRDNWAPIPPRLRGGWTAAPAAGRVGPRGPSPTRLASLGTLPEDGEG